MPNQDNLTRCPWVDLTKEDYVRYHDLEWGVPVYDDRLIFEFLTLEGAQAGLSWYTVLRKRENYRALFDEFDPVKVAGFDEQRIQSLLANPGIIRNRLKIRGAVNNAQRFLEVQEEFGGFSEYIWGFVGGRPLLNQVRELGDFQATSPESKQRPAATGFQIRRLHNHLRPHAGRRHGQRPYHGLLPQTANRRWVRLPLNDLGRRSKPPISAP